MGLFRILLVAPAVLCLSQAPPEERLVLAAVQRFFDAMEKRDPAIARTAVVPEGRYFAIRPDGKTTSSALAEFLERLPARKERLRERMFEPSVRVHGPLAMVWTAYDFHRDGKLSHCGVDAFTLIKVEGEWKIAALAYTVEPAGCASIRPAL
jgi:hypothetical protein